MSHLTYPRSATTIATKARMALGAYTAIPVREAAYNLHRSVDDMWGYTYFAIQNADGPQWSRLGKELITATKRLAAAERTPGEGPRHVIQVAAGLIARFEHAAGTKTTVIPLLPRDEDGRDHPVLGTERPFRVADIGCAAVQHLGPNWHAEALPWGDGSSIQDNDETHGYLLAVDEHNCLYICDDSRGGKRTELDGATPADGLDILAERVADLVLSLTPSPTDPPRGVLSEVES
ncbi:hypothetical protein [Streptomyces sp. MZ04]|uniref:hypothetical protein n=1 Tax=Streptomyces sp. MZ04 TaxID=2559236 RepID=UPI00107ED6D6|nr:hypothetical protein [Streptomyces sp. MZ04]TGA92812.1 hypothetical protein E2651_36225 [Streptomyces sp. MZ04]